MEGGRSPTGIEALVKVDFYWGFVVDAAVRSERVIGLLEVRNTDFGIEQINEPFSIETCLRFTRVSSHAPRYIPEATVEAFDKRILPRAARLNVYGIDLVSFQPTLDGLSDQLRAVVAADTFRCAQTTNGLFQCLDNILGRERTPGFQYDAITAVFVYDAQDTDASTILSHVMNKIPTPDIICLRSPTLLPP